jgi:hypothetical protein
MPLFRAQSHGATTKANKLVSGYPEIIVALRGSNAQWEPFPKVRKTGWRG